MIDLQAIVIISETHKDASNSQTSQHVQPLHKIPIYVNSSCDYTARQQSPLRLLNIHSMCANILQGIFRIWDDQKDTSIALSMAASFIHYELSLFSPKTTIWRIKLQIFKVNRTCIVNLQGISRESETGKHSRRVRRHSIGCMQHVQIYKSQNYTERQRSPLQLLNIHRACVNTL